MCKRNVFFHGNILYKAFRGNAGILDQYFSTDKISLWDNDHFLQHLFYKDDRAIYVPAEHFTGRKIGRDPLTFRRNVL